MSFLGFDHIDCRVSDLAAVESFYDALMPRLGLSKKKYSFVENGQWNAGSAAHYNTVEYVEAHARPAHFFGVIQDRSHQLVDTRIAFRIPRHDLDAFQAFLAGIGARDIDRETDPGYPAIFFTDPLGTRLEVIGRS